MIPKLVDAREKVKRAPWHEMFERPAAWRINFQQVQMPSSSKVGNLSRHPRSQNVIRRRWESDTENYLSSVE